MTVGCGCLGYLQWQDPSESVEIISDRMGIDSWERRAILSFGFPPDR